MDTNPTEPIQVAISMFCEKSDQKRHHSSAGSDVFISVPPEIEKERDSKSLMKEVANYKLQLQAKDSAHMLALLNLEHYEKSADELSTLLQNSNAERDNYSEECEKSRSRTKELELKIKEMTDQASENKLKDEILMIKKTARESEKKKDVEIELLVATKIKAEEQLKDFRKQMETLKELENQVMNKSILIDSLQLQIKQANEVFISNEKTNCDNLAKLVANIEVLERKNTDQSVYIEDLERERDQLNLELENANSRIKMFAVELEKANTEIDWGKEKYNEEKFEMTTPKLAAATEIPKTGDPRIKTSPQDDEFLENKEYESLTIGNSEIEMLRKDLEMAKARLSEFRTRTEQAITRADSAEGAKFMLQAQLRKHKEQRQRRKAALEALKEECVSVYDPSSCISEIEIYQPLGQILNMEC
ncbi:hypothetical protein ACFE04_010280 [Oxalis oulophora]